MYLAVRFEADHIRVHGGIHYKTGSLFSVIDEQFQAVLVHDDPQLDNAMSGEYRKLTHMYYVKAIAAA